MDQVTPSAAREIGDAGGANTQRVSAIVVSYHTGEVLFECIGALLGDAAIADIVIVDNGNPPDVRARLETMAANDARVTLVGEGKNLGFAAGVNLGAKAATGDRLLVLNPDAVLQPGALAQLEAARDGAREPAIIGGKIVGEDGKEQRGARRRKLTLASATATYLGLGWLHALHPAFVKLNMNADAEPSGRMRVGAVSGALMYLSRGGFDALDGFDEGYFLHVEDIDICRRAEEAGGDVIYTPDAVALHHGATSDAPRAEVQRHKAAGLARYFRKFARTPVERVSAAVFAPLFGLALQMRATMRGG